MNTTYKSISVSRLKAHLSEHLRRVKAGETILITERGRPIGMMTPLPLSARSADIADLIEAGLMRPPKRPVDLEELFRDRPADAAGSVRRALIEERRTGR